MFSHSSRPLPKVSCEPPQQFEANGTTAYDDIADMGNEDVFDFVNGIEKGMLPNQLDQQRDIFNLGVPLFKVNVLVRRDSGNQG